MSEVVSLLFRLDKIQKCKEITSTSFPPPVLQTRHMVTCQELVMLKEGKWLSAKSFLPLFAWLKLTFILALVWTPSWQPQLPCLALAARTAWNLLCVGSGANLHWVLSCTASVHWCFSVSWLCPLSLCTSCTTLKDKSQERSISLQRLWYCWKKKVICFPEWSPALTRQGVTPKHTGTSSSWD